MCYTYIEKLDKFVCFEDLGVIILFFIIILFFVILITFSIYKLCVYLNDNSNFKKKKINNIILKVCLSGLFVILILWLYNGIDGYLNGNEGFFCGAVAIGDCYDYGINGAVQRIIQKFYWTILMLIIFLLYIIIYKIKYKEKIITNKLPYFSVIIVITLISFFPLYKTIINKFYFHFTNYNYEIIIKGFDYNDYYIHVYDKKINVVKKEQVICITTPCNPIYNGEYEINFSDEIMTEIYNYIDNSFNNKNFTSQTIIFNNIVDSRESNIVKSIITNDETYIKETNNYYNYKIITDFQYKTLQNDGGSHINVYYQVNLKKNKIIKYEDKYVGFKGYKYKDKIIYEKIINNSINSKLKTIIEDLIAKEDINDKNNYSPYVIEFDDIKKEIYNSESIDLLENILTLIDKQ